MFNCEVIDKIGFFEKELYQSLYNKRFLYVFAESNLWRCPRWNAGFTFWIMLRVPYLKRRKKRTLLGHFCCSPVCQSFCLSIHVLRPYFSGMAEGIKLKLIFNTAVHGPLKVSKIQPSKSNRNQCHSQTPMYRNELLIYGIHHSWKAP